MSKAAAQPFKNVQVQLNDTFATLHHAASMGTSRGGGLAHSASRGGLQRSQTTQPELTAGKRLDPHLRGGGGGPHVAPEAGLNDVVAALQAMHDGMRESTGLVRLDLQQHTALQVRARRHRRRRTRHAGAPCAGAGVLWPLQQHCNAADHALVCHHATARRRSTWSAC